jgi:hypothetical protein
MIITNVIVEKIEKDHPRYPDQATVEFTEVYRCEVTFDDGRQTEATFFVTPKVGDMTPARVGDMLSLFARSIKRMGETAEAA